MKDLIILILIGVAGYFGYQYWKGTTETPVEPKVEEATYSADNAPIPVSTHFICWFCEGHGQYPFEHLDNKKRVRRVSYSKCPVCYGRGTRAKQEVAGHPYPCRDCMGMGALTIPLNRSPDRRTHYQTARCKRCKGRGYTRAP